MILLFSRQATIRFNPLTHRLAQGRDWVLNLRRLGQGAGGAQTVSDNLRRALARQTHVHWNQSYRDCPENPSDVQVVWVVRGAGNLRWAIANKTRLGARSLWAGPNIAVVPQEEGGALLSPAIDRFMAPSEWVAALYRQEAPNLREKVRLWPVGLDVEYWKPITSKKTHLLIYNKRQDDLCQSITAALKDNAVPYAMIRYGSYSPQDYRDLLGKAWGLVWLSETETQGLAALEALSMDVPVLAWNPGRWTYNSRECARTFSAAASSVPYFDDRCGKTFENADHFIERLALFQKQIAEFQPRRYVMDNHLDLESNLNGWGVFQEL